MPSTEPLATKSGWFTAVQRNWSQGGRKVSLDHRLVPHVPHSSWHVSLSADSEGQAAAEELRSERYRYSGAA